MSVLQLHVTQEHPDMPLLEHVKELITQLDGLGIQPSPEDEAEDGNDGEEWEDVEGSEDEDGDIDMS